MAALAAPGRLSHISRSSVDSWLYWLGGNQTSCGVLAGAVSGGHLGCPFVLPPEDLPLGLVKPVVKAAYEGSRLFMPY